MLPKIILIVDDDKKLTRLVSLTLGNRYQTLACHDGSQALQLVREQKPHLILLDIKIPKVDGLEVCRQIKRSIESTIPKVIMLTGVDSNNIRDKASNAGADAYFVKPFSPRELLDKVVEVLEEDV